MSELKKCSGCGGEAKFNEQFNGCIPRISKSVFYSCECGWCGPIATGKCETREDLFRLAERAAEAWNRRADHLPDATKMVSNADRIRSMSDEELAEWLDGLRSCGTCNRYHNKRYPINETLDWLQQPAEE